MTLFHLHDDFAVAAGDRRFTFARASVWLAMTLKTIHEAIVAARTRGQQRELCSTAISAVSRLISFRTGRLTNRRSGKFRSSR